MTLAGSTRPLTDDDSAEILRAVDRCTPVIFSFLDAEDTVLYSREFARPSAVSEKYITWTIDAWPCTGPEVVIVATFTLDIVLLRRRLVRRFATPIRLSPSMRFSPSYTLTLACREREGRSLFAAPEPPLLVLDY